MGYAEFYRRSIDDRDAFWAEQARLIDWKQQPRTVCDDSHPPFTRWFAGSPSGASATRSVDSSSFAAPWRTTCSRECG